MDAQAIAAGGLGARPSRARVSGLRDEALARLAGGGSERAFAALYERYHARLYRYCSSIVRHEADAQDALQATFVSAYGALRASRRDAPVRPWLFRIAHNESITVLRQRRSRDEVPDDLAAVGAEVETQAAERERLHQLIEDLQALPERQRSALTMRELSGLSHEEIAVVLGSTVAAAKQTIFEARRTLTEYAAGRAMSCDEICRLISDGDRRALRSRRVKAHVRQCSACSGFADAIRSRSADLRALAPPLPPALAAAILSRVTGGAGSGGGGCGAAASGAGAKAAVTATAAKVATGVAVISATVGAAAIVHSERPARNGSSGGHSVLTSSDAHAGIGQASREPIGASPGATLARSQLAHGRAAAGHGAAPAGAGARGPRRTSKAAAEKRGTGSGSAAPGSGHGFSHGSGAGRGWATAGSEPFRGFGPGAGGRASGNSEAAAAPGRSGSAPGRSGSAPGRSGSAPGRSGSAPGRSGSAPGRSGSAPGRSGSSAGGSGAPGLSGTAPGLSAIAPGLSGSAPGQLKRASGTSPQAPASAPTSAAGASSASTRSAGSAGAAGATPAAPGRVGKA